jgi:hypothetical protein
LALENRDRRLQPPCGERANRPASAPRPRAAELALVPDVEGLAGTNGLFRASQLDKILSPAHIRRRTEGYAALLPMDGYHYDDGVLIERGLRARKGAPETFDVLGLLHMLDRLKRNQEDEIAVPVFDRDLEISRAGARLIPRAVRALIVEGNYLLLDRKPWSCLRAMFDVTVAVDAPERTSCDKGLSSDGRVTVSLRHRSRPKSKTTTFPTRVTSCRRAGRPTSCCAHGSSKARTTQYACCPRRPRSSRASNNRFWRNCRVSPRSAIWCIPAVHKADLEGQLRVDFARS